jgi:hypothetical protein
MPRGEKALVDWRSAAVIGAVATSSCSFESARSFTTGLNLKCRDGAQGPTLKEMN